MNELENDLELADRIAAPLREVKIRADMEFAGDHLPCVDEDHVLC